MAESFKERMISVRGAICIFLLLTTVAGAGMLFYCFHDQSDSYSEAVNGTVTGLPSQYSQGASLTFLVSAMTLAPLLNVFAFIFDAHQWVIISTGLTSVLAPAFIVQLAFFSACEDLGSTKCSQQINGVDPNIAMAGYVLMILSVYFSFLLVPASLQSFHRQKHRMYLGIATVIAFISLTAAILFFTAAGQVKNPDNAFWSIAQSDFVTTGVQNLNAVLFFLGAVILRSEPFGHAALFYLASFYVSPLLPALNSNSLAGLVSPNGSTGDVLNENTFVAASALGYAGIVSMALFLLHRFRYSKEHNEDEESHSYNTIEDH